MQAPLDVTVLRSGVSDTFPGRSVNVCERGIGAVLAGELVPGETVSLEVRFSGGEPLRARALVRYQDRLRCGFEFVAMSPEQRAAVRDWAKNVKVERQATEIAASLPAEPETKFEKTSPTHSKDLREIRRPYGSGGGGYSGRRKKHGVRWLVATAIFAIVAGGFWWKWNHDWEQLESGLNTPAGSQVNKPQTQVPAEVMQKLLIHRVEPVYPSEARKENVQGVIALNVVVGRDGSVVSMHALNGPEILARAAMDAMRWWKFEPYKVNGEPAIVETTLAMEFKR
jgi:TonB family protein